MTAGWAACAPEVENFSSGDEVRHPVVLLRGKVEDGAERLSVRTSAGGRKVSEAAGEIEGGRFKALVELKEGENVVEVKTERPGAPLRLKLNYRPMTNPHYVRLIWLTGSEGETDFATPEDGVAQTFRERVATAGRLMQSFTAERMHELGYGRRTFRLEADAEGTPVVHVVKAPLTAEEYRGKEDSVALWHEIQLFLDRETPDSHAKNLVLMAFTRKDEKTGKMLAHTALGGGNLGLFGSASVFCWPESVAEAQRAFSDTRKVDASRVHEDSAGRGSYWAVASTTMGATLHEMGHTFGLPHCKDRRCIMTRGFDGFNRFFVLTESRGEGKGEAFGAEREAWFAPVSASYLRWSRWFEPDKRTYDRVRRPELKWDGENGLEVETQGGLRWLGFYEGGDVAGFMEFRDEKIDRKEISLREIEEANGGRTPDRVEALDENGNTGRVELKR